MGVMIYVEGGGDGKTDNIRCRAGFRTLLEKAGFKGRMPRIVACGARDDAYGSFHTDMTSNNGYLPILLVDSEEVVGTDDMSPDSPAAWSHLEKRDGWNRPPKTDNDQAQLMVTCMETWMMADRESLVKVFGDKLITGRLLPLEDLEKRSRGKVQESLEAATRNCDRDKAYAKGRRSFQVLSHLDPSALKANLPHFERLIRTLDRRLR